MQIKVTGFLDTEEMDPAYVDESHETGLSNLGYERYYGGEAIEGLDDLEFKAVKNT